MWSKRIQELVAIMVAGEGVLALLSPVGHLRLWQGKTGWTRRATQPLIDNPSAMRLLAAAQLVGAIAWSRHLLRR